MPAWRKPLAPARTAARASSGSGEDPKATTVAPGAPRRASFTSAATPAASSGQHTTIAEGSLGGGASPRWQRLGPPRALCSPAPATVAGPLTHTVRAAWPLAWPLAWPFVLDPAL